MALYYCYDDMMIYGLTLTFGCVMIYLKMEAGGPVK